MTSKERVRAVLAGRLPDRVPYGEFAVDFDTVEKILGHETYLRAKAKSQIAGWEGRRDEVAESWRRDHIELHRKLDLDIVTFPAATWELPPETDDPPPRRVDAATWEDKYGRIYKFSAATQDITCVRDPVRDAEVFTPARFEAAPPPARRDERSWAVLDAVIREFKDEKFILGPSGGEIGVVLLGGMERGLIELVEIVLWGGVSVENLIQGTPADVRADVRRAMEIAKPGGRFILGTSHGIAVGSRCENYMAMLDEFRKLRAYGES